MKDRSGDLVSRTCLACIRRATNHPEKKLIIRQFKVRQDVLHCFQGVLNFGDLYGGVRVLWALNLAIRKEKSSHFGYPLACRVQVDGDFSKWPRVRECGQCNSSDVSCGWHGGEFVWLSSFFSVQRLHGSRQVVCVRVAEFGI